MTGELRRRIGARGLSGSADRGTHPGRSRSADRGTAKDLAEVADRGVSTVEVVILAPVCMVFVLFVVALGMTVSAQNQATGAARDAARAGAMQRDLNGAEAAARQAAKADMGNKCAGGPLVLVT